METISSVLGLIRKGDYMFSINLKDAYFQIPFHPGSQPYLRIELGEKVYQFNALCISLSTGPQVLASVFALVFEVGSQDLCYCDDWLVISELVSLLLQRNEQPLQRCKDLVIVINIEKSYLEPISKVQYPVMLINTV